MRRRDRSCQALALERRRPGDHRHGVEDADGLECEKFRVARADADAIQGSGHGLVAANTVTGIAGFQPRYGPTGSTRDTAIRVSSPPHLSCNSVTRASPSSVTTLATSRPRGGRADRKSPRLNS